MIDATTIDQLWKDSGWRGALTILLGSPQLSNDGRVWSHIEVDRQAIQFGKILEDRTFSSGERSLIEIAASLFDQEVKVNLWGALNRLDDRSTKFAVTAICNFARVRDVEKPVGNHPGEKPQSKQSRTLKTFVGGFKHAVEPP